MKQRPGRPPLVVLDFNALIARRYWPKPGDQRPATFITQTGTLTKDEKAPWQMGNDDGLALIESFRRGELVATPVDGDEQQPEAA